MAKKRRIQFEKLDPKGIPLAELIAVHGQFASHSGLPQNIGDGFLYATNGVFRNIREAYLARGFAFTTQDRWNYFAFPLMSLDDVIAARMVPYRDNFIWLEKIEKVKPGVFTLTEIKKSELQLNYLFHESAHFIAHAAYFGKQSPRRAPKNAESLLKIFMGEAFANTVEALSGVFTEGEIGRYFLEANCHFRANEKEVAQMKRAMKKIGAAATAKILVASFLYSNFLFEKLGVKEKKLIAEFAGLPKKTPIDPLVKIGLQLNEEFRTLTTYLHLLKTGFRADFPKMMKRDPLLQLKKYPKIGRETEKLVLSLVRGLDAQI